MRNVRGAGRKSRLSESDLAAIASRRQAGESVAALAAEYGISRQALNKHLKDRKSICEIPLDYVVDGLCISRMYINVRSQSIRLENYAARLSSLPFGWNEHPDWERLGDQLEEIYFSQGQESGDFTGKSLPVCREAARKDFSLLDIMNQPAGGERLRVAEEYQALCAQPRFTFRHRDLLYARTDTDGFQFKALSSDRRWFVKSQAVISGLVMRDWMVEVIATHLCEQLNIPCVVQYPCEFIYEGRKYHGVYSRNYELDGYTFVSFERLLERMGKSSREEEFIHLDAVDKLHWCAEQLAQAGNLPIEETTTYMLNLALLDCLVGNVDRHTRNFGLFFQAESGRYEIPLAFDHGMGLFEHDYYRDQYANLDEAMRNVYVAPYGEDPFELIRMLDEAFDLKKCYPVLEQLDWGENLPNDFAREYIERMKALWQK